MVEINPQKIEGNWHSGIALDLHTVSSTPIGHNQFGHVQFETVYTPLGELLRRLKYKSEVAAAQPIIDTAVEYLSPYIAKFDIIVPVPPSGHRPVQPVILMANGIGNALRIPVIDCIRTTRPTPQLKDIQAPDKRRELLVGLHTVDPSHTTDKKILLLDDLFRSGSTMNAITDVLMGIGRANVVRVLTITRTRSNR